MVLKVTVMEKRIIETSRSDFYGIAYCMTAKPMPIVTNHIQMERQGYLNTFRNLNYLSKPFF